MLITRTSLLSGITHTRDIPCTAEQLQAWQNGQYIQNAMPNVSDSDREFLISGVTPEEWDEAFGEEEDA